MKKITLLSLLIIGVVVGSCKLFKPTPKAPDDGVKRIYTSKPVRKPVLVKTASGLEYTILSAGSGPKANVGDRISVLYTGKLTNDTVFDASSRHGNMPYTYKIGANRVIKGWDEVGAYLHGGDRVLVRIPPALGYGANPMQNIPANSTLVFEMEITEVKQPPTARDAKGLDTLTTASGLKIIVFEPHPEAPLPKAGQRLQVHYSGFFMDGKLFESSLESGAPIQFVLGKGQVIRGWDEGFALLHTGEKAKLIIPPALGYGARQNGQIPPNSTLMFDIELVSIQ